MKKVIIAVLISVLCLQGCVPHTTGETEVGVRTIKFAFFGQKGVVDEPYEPGTTYFFMPFVNDWNTFDTKLDNMEMIKKDRERDSDDLLFKTIDGNDISLDVIVSYRIDKTKVVHILKDIASSTYELREKVVRPVARSVCRDIFGELKTEDFYIAEKRTQKSEEIAQSLNRILNPMGVIVERILPKDYRFNPAYKKAIEDKKVAEQLAEKNKSSSKAAAEEYKKLLEDAQGTVNEMMANVDGEIKKAMIKADAYYEQQKMLADAIEAEGRADAKAIEKMNEALNGSGGETMIKLKIAEILKGKRLILLPLSESGGMNLQTIDMNNLLEMYGVKTLAKPK